MALARRDDWLTDALGRALPGAQVYYCNQPATTSVIPPFPLTTVSSDLAGDPATNPQTTDGFGHAVAYLDDSVLYTIVYAHPLFGQYPVVLIDQSLGGGGGGGSVSTFAGIPSGTIDGTNRIFLMMNGANPLTAIPTQFTIWLNFPLIVNVGYTVALVAGQVQITYAVAPQIGDTLYDEGIV